MRFSRLIPGLLLAATLPAADPGIPTAMNAFTIDTYRQVAEGDGNLILSPFNIATALSMALVGARGQTAGEIRTVLHGLKDPAPLLAALEKAGDTGGNELHAANGLWVQKGFPIQPAFEKTLAGDYHAPVTLLDFLTNPEAARSRINTWTAEQTKDKIKDLFPAGSFNAQTRLVLTSAIYFYGKWESQFTISKTAPAPFTLLAGTATQANFMNQTARFGYTETDSAQILEMRYGGTGIAFDVLLPKTPSGLPALEKLLTPQSLTGWLATLATHTVQVSLPKFKTGSAFDLGAALSTMGMPTAFSNQADFSGIDGRRDLNISKVVHKAFVDLSEQGTEAAAATGVVLRSMAMRRPEPPIVFRADHPFLFLIRDTTSGAVLFIGRLMDPRR